LFQERHVKFRALSPAFASVVINTSVFTVLIRIEVSFVNDLLNDFLFTVFVSNNLFDFFCFDIVLKFTIKFFTEAFDNSSTILLEAVVNYCVSSRKSKITLVKDIYACKNASCRQNANTNSGAVQLNEVECCMRVNNCNIFLGLLKVCHRKF
jgi:hypothetical protein